MTTLTLEKTEKTYYTSEEYLILEEQSEEKHEYRDGEIITMTGGTNNHNTLTLKFAFLLLSFLEDQNYDVYMGDIRLWIEKKLRYTYPDVMVVEGNPVYQENWV